MNSVDVDLPRKVHALPGRIRVHMPGWEGQGASNLEARVRRMRGVSEVRFGSLTRNVLIRFDPRVTDDESILAALRALQPERQEEIGEVPEAPPAQRERAQLGRGGSAGRVRIVVRGIDRDPELARRVVERLEDHHPSVKASASQLTGRVRVEFDKREVGLEELLSMVTGLELPGLSGEDRPTHPLDRGPLYEGATGTVGASLGLGLHAGRRLMGLEEPLVDPTVPVAVASAIGLLEGFPVPRMVLHRLLGERMVRLLLGASTVVLLTFSGSTLGLLVAGAEALRLLTEVRARRGAWRSYENRLESAAPVLPGALVRPDAGGRAPLAAKVLEGVGTATARDGLPVPVHPGATVAAGARLHGGPFALELVGHEPFIPEPRQTMESRNLHGHYVRAMIPIALLYTGATALLTRSFVRTFAALLLVNPRTAEIGRQFADTGASARVLRSDVTVVGTRPDRIVRRPDVLLLDGSRVLTDGLEVHSVLPQTGSVDATQILSLSSGIAASAGSPWGRAFPPTEHAPVTDGAFAEETATAEIRGTRYSLGPVGDSLPNTAEIRLQEQGCYLLRLRTEEKHLLGVIALQPRLATGVTELVETCEHRGVEMMLLDGDTVAARSVARRANVGFQASDNAAEAVRTRQANGRMVALVADSPQAAEGFAACDLAIGLVSGWRGRFPARADLLALEPEAVAAIVEAGARHEAAVRDSVLLSMVANVLGAAWGFRGAPQLERASHSVYITALAAMVDGWVRLRTPGL